MVSHEEAQMLLAVLHYSNLRFSHRQTLQSFNYTGDWDWPTNGGSGSGTSTLKCSKGSLLTRWPSRHFQGRESRERRPVSMFGSLSNEVYMLQPWGIDWDQEDQDYDLIVRCRKSLWRHLFYRVLILKVLSYTLCESCWETWKWL